MGERTRESYKPLPPPSSTNPEMIVAKMAHDALMALVEVIQHAAEHGAAAGVWWAMEWLSNTDAAQEADYVAYENWTAERCEHEEAQVESARCAMARAVDEWLGIPINEARRG